MESEGNGKRRNTADDHRMRRRDTVVEEDEVFIDSKKHLNKGKAKKKTLRETLSEIAKEIYNSEYREFLSKDAKSWCQLSLFYFVFYTLLSGFFILMVLVFYTTVDLKTPTYYNKESVMNYVEVNPGLGFRPQIDPESELVLVNSADYKTNFNYLDLFLENYEYKKNLSFTGAHGRKVTFDYEEVVRGSPCSREKFYGYNSTRPCVVVKLNRIFGWLPIVGSTSKYPFQVSKGNASEKYIYIHCAGENSADKDNIGPLDYYSSYPGNEIGGISFKYFPFRNQPNYLSPLVFVHFKNASVNTLINVECKAYAKNIDNSDRINRRGMVRFQLFIKSDK